MDRNSEEYRKVKAEYEAERERRKNDPIGFPYFIYFAFGWHKMDYISEEEKDESIKFYRGMYESKDEKGRSAWQRGGRQPIYISWAGDRKVVTE